MSLLTPSPGEIYDRLSIIALKIESGNDSQHLVIEHQALSRRLIEFVAALPGKGVSLPLRDEFNAKLLGEKLCAVNAFIWHKEDAIRALAKECGIGNAEAAFSWAAAQKTIAELAVEIRKLADRRHYLIAEIDRLFGEARAGKEKSWMPQPPAAAAQQGAPTYGFSGFGDRLK